ncbi:hypothetical protein [Cellulomonas xylanilytica]|uniref:hypothetical protein n=1 Tax=Cellulomonas xylanilytica TaxID=233583 RepID=UPI0011BF429C|nr:hypothetical protein [Cellulomonas xylanilytica]
MGIEHEPAPWFSTHTFTEIDERSAMSSDVSRSASDRGDGRDAMSAFAPTSSSARVCARAGCVVDLDVVRAHHLARYCSHACSMSAQRARRRERDAARVPQAVADAAPPPTRPLVAALPGEPFWSRRFRTLVSRGDVEDARRVWEYAVEFTTVERVRPSALALEIAGGLEVRVPHAWAD